MVLTQWLCSLKITGMFLSALACAFFPYPHYLIALSSLWVVTENDISDRSLHVRAEISITISAFLRTFPVLALIRVFLQAVAFGVQNSVACIQEF